MDDLVSAHVINWIETQSTPGSTAWLRRWAIDLDAARAEVRRLRAKLGTLDKQADDEISMEQVRAAEPELLEPTTSTQPVG